MKHSFILWVIILMFAITRSYATHFRGGTISWKPTGNRHEVEFTYKLGWRYNSGAGCTPSLVGSYVHGDLYNWTCTDCGIFGTFLSSAGYLCTAASKTQDWEQGEYSFKHTFSSAGKFTVSFIRCCWVILDYGTASGDISLSTTVDLRSRSDIHGPNTSPVCASKPIYTVKYGCTQKLRIPLIDQDGDNVRCRWAVGDECEGACNAIPNTILDEKNCVLTISATQGKGDTYAVALMIEDRPKSIITLNGETFTPSDVLTSIPLQFLVNTPDIPSRSCSDKPVFVFPTPEESEVIPLLAGTSLFVSFYATSKGSSISSFLSLGPPNLKQSSVRRLSLTPDVYSIDVTWNPSAADRGSNSLCVEATDANQISSDMRCIIIAAWDINECSSNPCINGGVCHDFVNRYKCSCKPGYTGIACEIDIDECIHSLCLNNGTCIDGINEYSCSCSPGFTGIICETDIDECESALCFNNGTCHDKINGYTCQCKPGYTGTFCEIDIDECASDPCLHNGICFDLINSFFCGCSLGYTGDQCETDIDECEDGPCIHSGNCTDLIGKFSCDCLPGFSGKNCQIGLDPCSSMPCKNDGLCVTHNSTFYTCECVAGWDGLHCAFRQQNESFYNSSFMTNTHMQYSECSCLLGNIKQQICYKYKTEEVIGYGIFGAFLGLLTVVVLYLVATLCINKNLTDSKINSDKVTKERDDRKENIEEHKKDLVDQIPEVPPKVKPHISGHRHRKCWACDVKYNAVPPPRFW